MSDSRVDVEELGDKAYITALWCGESQCLILMHNLQSCGRELILHKCTDVRLDIEIVEEGDPP